MSENREREQARDIREILGIARFFYWLAIASLALSLLMCLGGVGFIWLTGSAFLQGLTGP